MQVERSDRPVQRGADDDEAAGGEGDVSDAAGVLGERHEAVATVGVPHFDLNGLIQSELMEILSTFPNKQTNIECVSRLDAPLPFSLQI